MMNPTNGKGSDRRKENTPLAQENLGGVRYGVRDKSGDTFKFTVKGKRNDNS